MTTELLDEEDIDALEEDLDEADLDFDTKPAEYIPGDDYIVQQDDDGGYSGHLFRNGRLQMSFRLGWVPGKSKRGKLIAVGVGNDAGKKPVYGKAAESRLRSAKKGAAKKGVAAQAQERKRASSVRGARKKAGKKGGTEANDLADSRAHRAEVNEQENEELRKQFAKDKREGRGMARGRAAGGGDDRSALRGQHVGGAGRGEGARQIGSNLSREASRVKDAEGSMLGREKPSSSPGAAAKTTLAKKREAAAIVKSKAESPHAKAAAEKEKPMKKARKHSDAYKPMGETGKRAASAAKGLKGKKTHVAKTPKETPKARKKSS